MPQQSDEITIIYEHPHWYKPLFNELERRGVPHERLDIREASLETHTLATTAPLVLNRLSPSAWTRGARGSIVFGTELLESLENAGVDTFNGSLSYRLEISKAAQSSRLRSLGVHTPRTVVVPSVQNLPEAAHKLLFPLIVKPNVGGSGAGIRRFDTPADLREAVESEGIDTGFDGVVLLQEYHPPRGNKITRIETLAAKFLYAIEIHLDGADSFDLCPADVCRTTDDRELVLSACPADAAKSGLRVANASPSREIVGITERIASAFHLDVGGIELLESDRDGLTYFYDVNALSNFVADPLAVIGFDPTERLVDELLRRRARRAA